MIELENVSMTYPGGNQALKNVNINIEKGEFVFIVGSSGSGKTTLFRLLLKELDPTEGNITVAGYDYGKIKRKDIPKVRRRIGVVFQNFRLLKDRTIYENVAFAQRVIQTPARYIRRRVPAMLTLVGLADKYKSYPKELSGGEQQRVICIEENTVYAFNTVIALYLLKGTSEYITCLLYKFNLLCGPQFVDRGIRQHKYRSIIAIDIHRNCGKALNRPP